MNSSYIPNLYSDYTNTTTITSTWISNYDDEVAKLRTIVENLLDTVISLRLDVAVMKEIITIEEKESITKMLHSADSSAVELAKTLIDEFNI